MEHHHQTCRTCSKLLKTVHSPYKNCCSSIHNPTSSQSYQLYGLYSAAYKVNIDWNSIHNNWFKVPGSLKRFKAFKETQYVNNNNREKLCFT